MSDKWLIVSLDGSGSMITRRSVTVSSLNEYLNTVKSIEGLKVQVINWDNLRYDILYSGDIKDVPVFTEDMYKCEGLTPLFDAFGRALFALNALPEGKKMLMLMTDGVENASSDYNLSDVKRLVKVFQEAGNDVIFLGAGLDGMGRDSLMQVAAQAGIPRANTLSFDDSETQEVYAKTACATRWSLMSDPDDQSS